MRVEARDGGGHLAPTGANVFIAETDEVTLDTVAAVTKRRRPTYDLTRPRSR